MDREVLKRSVVIWCGSDAAASSASLIAAQRSECDILHATSCRALGGVAGLVAPGAPRGRLAVEHAVVGVVEVLHRTAVATPVRRARTPRPWPAGAAARSAPHHVPPPRRPHAAANTGPQGCSWRQRLSWWSAPASVTTCTARRPSYSDGSPTARRQSSGCLNAGKAGAGSPRRPTLRVGSAGAGSLVEKRLQPGAPQPRS